MKTKWTVGPLFVAGLCALYCANPMNLFWPFFGACALHELGHFIAAKSVGVKVNEFAFGMGPAIFKKQKGETQYSVRLVPLGGYCAMEGEK